MVPRATTAFRQSRPNISQIVSWLFRSRELTNFTYALTPRNIDYLASTIAVVTGQEPARIKAFLDEIQNDELLRAHIRRKVRSSPARGIADGAAIEFGRRMGWYAVVRAIRPKIVIETGVDKGLGSCVLCAALLRNKEEGFPGRYIGTEINRNAGYLLDGAYATTGEILYGDSLSTLRQFDEQIDLFINDSDHSVAYERDEYATVERKLSPQAIVLGDNSHESEMLYHFAIATSRQFLFFREEPLDHWELGAGIGIAFRTARNQSSS